MIGARPGRHALGLWASVLIAAVAGSSVPSVAHASAGLAAPSKREREQSFDALMAQAERQRQSVDFAASGASYAEAFRVLPPRQRIALKGELAIDNALADYALAREDAPDERRFITEPKALLEEFVQARAAAHEAGRADPVPEHLAAQLRALVEADEQWVRQKEQAEAEAQAEAEPVTPEPVPEPPKEPRAANRSVPLLVAGSVMIAGGAALVAAGAWNFRQVDRQTERRMAGLDAGNYSDGQRTSYLATLEHWQQRWRRTATGLVVGGAVAGVAGVGFLVWGVVSRRAQGRTGTAARLRLAPRLSPRGGGLEVRVAF